ncbi:MerR family transcriptional regulator [Actinorhabdospora filicis]|uniref:MerR family transcriptional regulator n=1 Tax=Actinorhabdospora filicis TaxID=1785913 RepID=A0A9W6SJA9_9ACTN|nr:MerR family transcriptional regulator [Actinorhabdospora filicis]GLZ77298.1 MerR family transcriptional regulator [Actinorhabdospora filicis]
MTQVIERFSIGQVAERTGLSVHTLRFYEREGIFVTPPTRDANGRRVYTSDDVDWLNQVITKFRASGMPMDAIRAYVALAKQGPGNERERLAILQEHQERVLTQMDQLQEALKLITYKVGVYEDRVAEGTAGLLWTGRKPG